ncbi:MAG: WHG domain-containing protein [Clostridia bacterium]|nr:WHG domain-containing protein [Clostridia bacterium]
MSAIKKVERESIISAAVKIVRRGGMSALNARALSKMLGCSTRPIYLTFGGMDGVKAAVVENLRSIYMGYINRAVQSNEYPPYKAYGMGYIKFAREESEAFRYLFMRNRGDEEEVDDGGESTAKAISALRQATGLDEEQAKLFHLEIWIFVHGIAVMAATRYADFNEEIVSKILTDAYFGLKARFTQTGGN